MRGVGGQPALAGQREQPVELGAEADGVGRRGDAALEAEQRHRDPPAVVHLADDLVRRRPGVGEEDLVEQRVAGHVADRPDLDARLVHRHQQEGDARCLGASKSVRASRKMWSARWPADVQVFWPLITHSSPSSTAEVRMPGEVGTGVRLGVALAPALLAGQDPRQVVRLLLLGAQVDQGVAEHADAERVVLAALRRAGEGELLGQHHLLDQRQAGAAVLLRPGHRQHLVARRGCAATARGSSSRSSSASAAHAGPAGRQVLAEEGRDPRAELLRLRRVRRCPCPDARPSGPV